MWEVPEGVQRYPQFFIINKNAIIITTCHIWEVSGCRGRSFIICADFLFFFR